MQSTNEMCEELHDQPSQRAVRTSGFEGEVSTAMEVEGAEALGIGEPLGGVAEAASGAEERHLHLCSWLQCRVWRRSSSRIRRESRAGDAPAIRHAQAERRPLRGGRCRLSSGVCVCPLAPLCAILPTASWSPGADFSTRLRQSRCSSDPPCLRGAGALGWPLQLRFCGVKARDKELINPLPFPGIRLSVRTPFLRFPARSRSGGAIFSSWSHQPSPRAT